MVEKIEEELSEVKSELETESGERIHEELGDLLFAVVNLCRFTGGSAEEALQKTITRFTGRFQEMEARVQSSGRRVEECDLDELETHWQAVKKNDRSV